MSKNAESAKPTDDRLSLRFPYEIIRLVRSDARKTGTTEIVAKVDPADIVNGKLREGAEVEFSGYKRDGKTRALKVTHAMRYTKPLAAKSDDD